MHCMIYHYSGFPDLYEPILEAVKDLPKPSEEKVKLILNQSAWTSQSNALASCLPRLSGKSETGKTGLVNLGNTCYMNSVLQALFMATDFRRQVLSLNLNGCNSLMKKLQHLFAFLAHTQREAYAPQVFFEASRPPWFTPRSQQDCSEYLRFLLDRLHEEEKTLKALSSRSPETMIIDGNVQPCSPSRTDVFPSLQNTSWRSDDKTLIESMFGGKLQTNICCLNCRSTSQKIEAFSDLSLAFCPSAADKPAQNMICSPTEKDDDCIEIDVTPETEPRSETLPSTECDNDSTKLKAAGTGIQANSSCALHTPTCESTVECAIDSCRNSGRDKPLSVTDLLNYFLAPEILDGENRYHCEKCSSLQNAEKTMQILEEPEYLILTLLRFSYDPKCHVRRKILDNVSIPLVLELPVERTTSVASPGDWNRDVDIPDVGENLAKKLKPSGTEDVSCTQLLPYVLSSIVVHSGTSSESGHYYSYARNITNSTRCIQPEKSTLTSNQCQLVGKETCNAVVGNDKPCNDLSKEWFLFNDSRVTFTSFQSVLNITSRFPKDTAYVLIYKKHSSSDLENVQSNSAHGLWVNGEPPLQKELMDAITKDNKLYLQEQELNARTRALQAASASCSFRPNGFDDNDPPGSCGPTGGGGEGGFSTIGRLVF
ncbi:ubiquitin carboxyl-terminal hydrolase 38 isoform 2-T2 [Anomaloglossus baeobatrachus]